MKHIKCSDIFEEIQIANREDKQLSIELLCQVGEVSRSGYYTWRANEESRKKREIQDRRDFELVEKAFKYRYKKGSDKIYNLLLHWNIVMNIKKIKRLMKKYGLVCGYRKPNPVRVMLRAQQTSLIAPNIINREFSKYNPREALLTDITYIRWKNSFVYLSVIKDVCTHEILSYKLSKSLQIPFVLATVEEMLQKYNATLDDEVIIHSDQGCHYTSKKFIEKLADNDFIQSMSRRGNCWDNSPMESFFGHMKDEIGNLIIQAQSYEELESIIDNWMDYYNNERYVSSLERLSPVEYYQYKTTGVYPLKIIGGKSKNPKDNHRKISAIHGFISEATPPSFNHELYSSNLTNVRLFEN
ncbi:MAG: IS3 family transposase [Paludibacteraceae bacterium]|nr:IS3 family transposase [Paludibacteraceae bacterium]